MVEIITVVIAVLGWGYALRLYRELWKWARQCQGARIAVAYKRRVQLQAPLLEWLLWCNQLDQDKDSHGRVVYKQGYTTIAITKAVRPKWSHRLIRKAKPQAGTAAPSGPRVIQGKWAAKDESETKLGRSHNGVERTSSSSDS